MDAITHEPKKYGDKIQDDNTDNAVSLMAKFMKELIERFFFGLKMNNPEIKQILFNHIKSWEHLFHVAKMA